jgi:hypothetical protein
MTPGDLKGEIVWLMMAVGLPKNLQIRWSARCA